MKKTMKKYNLLSAHLHTSFSKSGNKEMMLQENHGVEAPRQQTQQEEAQPSMTSPLSFWMHK
jgi:hypothetical protein